MVGFFATSGQAAPGATTPSAPTTAAQAMAQLKAFNEQFEKVTEQFNDARILLGKRTAQSKAAAAKATAAAKTVSAFRGRIKQLVASESRSDPFGTFGAMLSSSSPGDFVSQASIIDVVSSRRAAVLTEATKASTAAAKAAGDAKAAQAAAAKLTASLAAKRTDLAKRSAQSQTMFNKLTASEKQTFLDSPPAADRASRDESRTPPASSGPTVNVPASGGAATAIAVARSKLGSPYVWAASGPSTFDCSGLTMYAWAAAGVSLPHSSQLQFSTGRQVSASSLQPGDLVFYGSPIHHVALYVGGGQVIHAPQTGDVVRYASVDMMPISGAIRP
ncbi:MAG TPA: C40 family peptidase [Mycobacteriales bacterium]|jgi:cell wall-associated NlpC family hydrolase|nr:C40 family peptidase [Mycobacteriales bacterium]